MKFRIDRFAMVFAAAMLLIGCKSKLENQNENAPISRPKLVLGIVVDQMRADYLERFWDNFGEGGFKRLLGEGYQFKECHYNYVPTETAPGHASIFTGNSPSGHGIIMNDWLDQADIASGKAKLHSSVTDPDHPYIGLPAEFENKKGASPFRLEAQTIADKLKAATEGKGMSVGISLKDRSAILPVGKSADAAFWFHDGTGYMVSSIYYPLMKGQSPAWLDAFNQKQLPKQLLSEGWQLLLPATRYIAADSSQDSLYECIFAPGTQPNFPYAFDAGEENCCGELKQTAMGNTFLKEFAKAAIPALNLGKDEVTDFLSLSFSSTDLVAHLFGPQSREVEDTYLRLDRDLEDLFNFLDQEIGKGQVLVFLTADHGGAPNPEYAKDHGSTGGWLNVKEFERVLKQQLGDKPGKDSLLYRVQGHNVYLNRELAQERQLDLDSLNEVVANTLSKLDGIEACYTRKQLLAKSGDGEGFEMLLNGFHPDRSGDVLFLMKYGYMKSPESETWRQNKGTAHGTHYAYDTHVPLVFWGWKVAHGSSTDKVVIPDIAPTVCKRLEINAPEKTSGKVLTF